MTPPNAKVLPFPKREETTRLVVLTETAMQPVVISVWHCHGGCGSLVSAPLSLCVSCNPPVEDAV